MLVEVSDASFVGMRRSIIVCIVGIVIVVEDILRVFEHPEAVIIGRPNSQVDGTSPMCAAQHL